MKWFIWIVVILIALGGAYFYRDQIKAAFMGASPSSQTTYYAPNYTAPTPTQSMDIINWSNGPKGQFAVGISGMTLYIFDKDTKGVSNCTGSCAGIWPPYTIASAPASLPANTTLITRSDGSMQFAYKGMPLYYYAGDKNPGDVTGDGFNGIWHLVKF